MFVTFLYEKAISLILQYGLLEKLVTYNVSFIGHVFYCSLPSLRDPLFPSEPSPEQSAVMKMLRSGQLDQVQ